MPRLRLPITTHKRLQTLTVTFSYANLYNHGIARREQGFLISILLQVD